MSNQAVPSEHRLPSWAEIAEAGGIYQWVDRELRRKGLIEDGVDTSTLSDKKRKAYKARREEERRVRKILRKQAWQAFRAANLVHLGAGVFHHDTADVDRFDVDDPEARLQENDVPRLKDVHALSKALDLPIPRLRWLTFHREVDTGTHYHRWTVPKRDGGRRLISAPKPDLKAAQAWIARRITERLPVHGAAHGFVGGRSTATNARVHAGADVVIKFDIKDFYPTVTWPRVKGVLRKAGYGEQVATVMALLCTESPREELELRGQTHYVATGPRSLPQGAPTSPSITNTLCLKMDARLTGLARAAGFAYSRYADDLTFSTSGEGVARLGRLMRGVRTIVEDEGFTVHPHKTRVMRKGGRQKITGLVVNSAPEGKPAARVPRKLVRQVRAAIHNRACGKPGKEDTEQLRGIIAYIQMADPARGRAMMQQLNSIDSDRAAAPVSEETP